MKKVGHSESSTCWVYSVLCPTLSFSRVFYLLAIMLSDDLTHTRPSGSDEPSEKRSRAR